MKGDWFNGARFGLFVHWGLYALPGGVWRGEEMEYIGEWVQSRFRIPAAEYERLAAAFNPSGFDADAWVAAVADAGMRYLVFTAKHHDGFAMYRSRADRFNVVDATPFGRDVLDELANACARRGVRLGVYYSQDLDWRHPDGGDPGPGAPKNHGMSWGNDWDFPDASRKVFSRYFEDKALPQVEELLTGYGPMSVIWFDCPVSIRPEDSRRLVERVRALQPECLVNTRVGHGLGDYGSFGDNQRPSAPTRGLWETPATLNRTWGFKRNDHDWKTPDTVIDLLASLAEKNTNYLLNVGPDPEGRFPEPAGAVLRAVGDWLRKYGSAVYGCGPNPFPSAFDWGYVTVTPGDAEKRTRLNVMVRGGAAPVTLPGLADAVVSVRDPAAPDVPVPFIVRPTGTEGVSDLRLTPPAGTGGLLALSVELDTRAAPRIDATPWFRDTVLHLPARRGRLRREGGTRGSAVLRGVDVDGERLWGGAGGRIDAAGNWVEWQDPRERIGWEVEFAAGGEFGFEIATVTRQHGAAWATGQAVEVSVYRGTAREAFWRTVLQGAPRPDSAGDCYTRVMAPAGRCRLDGPGRRTITVNALERSEDAAAGMAFSALSIVRVDGGA